MKRIPSKGDIVKIGHGDPLGFNLVIPKRFDHDTLWRPASPNLMGEVQYTIHDKFYQTRRSIAWVFAKMIGKRGRFQIAKLYYNQKTGERIA